MKDLKEKFVIYHFTSVTEIYEDTEILIIF